MWSKIKLKNLRVQEKFLGINNYDFVFFKQLIISIVQELN